MDARGQAAAPPLPRPAKRQGGNRRRAGASAARLTDLAVVGPCLDRLTYHSRDAARGAYRHRPTGRPPCVPVRRLRARADRLQGAVDAQRGLPATLESLAARVGAGGGITPGADLLTGAGGLPAVPIATRALDRDSRGPVSGRGFRKSLSGHGALAAGGRPLRGGGLHR